MSIVIEYMSPRTLFAGEEREMKKTINGARFDTKKATGIGRFNNGRDRNDFQFWEAALYVAPRSNRYFLAGTGGPMTRYGAKDISSGLRGSFGERIDPLSKESAFEWAKEYLSPEEIKKYFADMMKNG